MAGICGRAADLQPPHHRGEAAKVRPQIRGSPDRSPAWVVRDPAKTRRVEAQWINEDSGLEFVCEGLTPASAFVER
jgi:hypothetical protein